MGKLGFGPIINKVRKDGLQGLVKDRKRIRHSTTKPLKLSILHLTRVTVTRSWLSHFTYGTRRRVRVTVGDRRTGLETDGRDTNRNRDNGKGLIGHTLYNVTSWKGHSRKTWTYLKRPLGTKDSSSFTLSWLCCHVGWTTLLPPRTYVLTHVHMHMTLFFGFIYRVFRVGSVSDWQPQNKLGHYHNLMRSTTSVV